MMDVNYIQMAIEYLENGQEGDFVRNDENGYTAEVVNRCGGRYAVFDRNGEIAKLTDLEIVAIDLICKY